MHKFTRELEIDNGKPANVPARCYQLDDIIELADRTTAKPGRQRIEYVNVPGPDQDWTTLNQWRFAYGLPEVKPW